MSNYGFYFEKAGLTRAQGPTSADEEHFRGMTRAEAIVRELGQNSLDAVDTDVDGPVRMVFELKEMKTKDLYDIENLKEHIHASAEYAREVDASNFRLQRAADAIGKDTIWVLRVGDYGTRGLAGKEGKAHTGEPLAALTRGAGISSGKSGAGGSFGVGSSTGTLVSDIHTVMWTSLPKGENDVVLAAYSQLSSHNIDGVDYTADGIYTDRDYIEDFKYLRNPGPIGSFDLREVAGTDTYILGYSDAEEDPILTSVRDAFVVHFMVAIARGRLVVEGHTPKGNWELNASTLPKIVGEVEDAQPFYNALQDPEPYVKQIPELGELKLYVELDNGLKKKLHTISVRKPLMKIMLFKHTSITSKYAAIVDCSDEKANNALRPLEPPRHDLWDVKRGGPDDAKHLTKIKNFIREGLREKIQETQGEEIKIKGLSRFLPEMMQADKLQNKAQGNQPDIGESKNTESSTVQGKKNHDNGALSKPKRKDLSIQKPATSGGDEQTRGGRDGGGLTKRKSRGGSKEREGKAGEGPSRILTDGIKMRSWVDSGNGNIIMLLRSEIKREGDLELCALSDGGQVEEGFTLPISEVLLETSDSFRRLKTKGNLVKDLSFQGAQHTVKLHIKLTTKRRYRLGVNKND
ncbi:hypothetical protein [Corynebacterium dentalis]|uniref:hypothetical protein n=1 Tax=Corynebacterium dentalis TaxID=2014528 RepID=UPI002896776B|nr:hypothetical protein [Corynebacterium dentalis]